MKSASRKPPGAKPNAPAQNPPARVTVDRAQLAEIFRRIARSSANVADYANRLANHFTAPTPDTARPAKGSEARHG